MSVDHCTDRVTWSPEDGEHVGLCAEFPSLSWLAGKPEAAPKGIRQVVAEAVADMQAAGEPIPAAGFCIMRTSSSEPQAGPAPRPGARVTAPGRTCRP